MESRPVSPDGCLDCLTAFNFIGRVVTAIKAATALRTMTKNHEAFTIPDTKSEVKVSTAYSILEMINYLQFETLGFFAVAAS